MWHILITQVWQTKMILIARTHKHTNTPWNEIKSRMHSLMAFMHSTLHALSSSRVHRAWLGNGKRLLKIHTGRDLTVSKLQTQHTTGHK